MWSHQHIIICTALSCVISAEGLIQVFGYEGRAVNVLCPYGWGYMDNEKYLCKNNCGSSDVLITTQQKNKGKYSIYDKNRVVTVTISDLRLHDAGTYWCGISRWGKDLFTEVKLHIKEDRCCDTVDKTQSIEEGSVTISCPYDSQSVHKLKFFCRGNRLSTCLQEALITSSNTQHGRFKLSDDRRSRMFTVTISSLTLNDSGSYLCGVQRNSGFHFFSAVELEVKEFCLQSFNISDIEGRPVTLQCPNSIQQHDNKMFFCKGDQHNNCTDMMENQTKFKLHKVSSSCFSVIISELEAADAGTYYCGSDSQLSFRKILLAVVSPLPSSSVAPTITADQVTSQSPSLSPSSHNPDVSLFYILPAVFALLLILTFVLLLVLKSKTRIKQVDGINVNVLYSADSNVEMRTNDIYGLQEDVVYMNSSTPNMPSHDSDLYSNIL